MRYTPDQKTEAVDLADEHGPAEASRQTGIPRRTITSWRTEPAQATKEKTVAAREQLAASNATKRERLRTLLLDRSLDMLERMEGEHHDYRGTNEITLPRPPAQAVKDLSISVGILIDKYRLEMGEATGRTESVAESEIDRDLREAFTELENKIRAE